MSMEDPPKLRRDVRETCAGRDVEKGKSARECGLI